MKCPHCKETTLVISERQGIEIDYCPDCRGVWLDRGSWIKSSRGLSRVPLRPRPQSATFDGMIEIPAVIIIIRSAESRFSKSFLTKRRSVGPSERRPGSY